MLLQTYCYGNGSPMLLQLCHFSPALHNAHEGRQSRFGHFSGACLAEMMLQPISCRDCMPM